jgi:hypothetical protein
MTAQSRAATNGVKARPIPARVPVTCQRRATTAKWHAYAANAVGLPEVKTQWGA